MASEHKAPQPAAPSLRRAKRPAVDRTARALRGTADRAPGLSVRLKLTLSYAGFLVVASLLLIAVVWVFLLRYVPDQAVTLNRRRLSPNGAPAPAFIPGRSDLWRAFAPKAALVLGLVLLLGLVGGWTLAGRMLAPLNRIADATRAAGGGSLSHRIRMPGRRDEFRELADAFDGMLGQLEAHVAEQQRFAANASHELRTPLAITQTLLDVARKDPDADLTELVHRLRTVNTRAIDLTEALLLLSRADQRSFSRDHVDLSLAAEEAIETLLPLARKNGVTIGATTEAAPTVGSPALLLQLTLNLLHNAIVHNVAEGGRVRVSTGVDGGDAALVVENTGEQLSPQLVATLAEPFRRGTERIHADQAGVGLGLAIARSVVEAHDGDLALAARRGGGLRVTVRLPAEVSPAEPC